MPAKIHTGCCGWSYLNEREFPNEITGNYRSKLQAYAQLFDTVEINSTFYKLPRLATAEKWRREADETNPRFEFTVKAFKGITHLHRFAKVQSLDSFKSINEICSALRANCILFQTPAGFKPTRENVETMGSFFERIDVAGQTAVWEPRGAWYDNPDLIEKVCIGNNLVHCVDPFRNEPLFFGTGATAYFRLHGFGEPTMYRYNFSDEELRKLQHMINSIAGNVKDVYVFFNNDACYLNARTFLSTNT